ncbi:MAG TPA: prolyl oligopeptidase family serine peptidase [Planktothrix sp.]
MESKTIKYPVAEKGATVDNYSGVSVADPYRWLEDTNSEKTHAWVEEENTVTRAYLDSIPERGDIAKRLRELWNYERCGVPSKFGKNLFYSKNDGLQNQNVLYVKDLARQNARVLLDPNTLSKDGTVALSTYNSTDDGTLIAYGLSASGSDWEDWYVKDVSTGKDLSDHLKWLKNAEVAWSADKSGFYYPRYDEPKQGSELQQANYYQKLFFHKIGTAQSDDKLIYERRDDKELEFAPTVTDDGNYLVVGVYHGTSPKNGILIENLKDPASKLMELFAPGKAMYSLVGNDGAKFYFLTDEGAPHARVISMDTKVADGKISGDENVIVKDHDDTIEQVSYLDGKLICRYLKDACNTVAIYDVNGKFDRMLDLPGLGAADGFTGRQSDTDTYYSYTSFNTPAVIYHIDLNNKKQDEFFKPTFKFNSDDYVTDQIFCKSKDGTTVPVFVSHKKGIALDGKNPTYLYGYGGFKISLLPFYSPSNLLWMERGGVFAVATLRGGGEYGESWHQSGMKLNKQKVFDDFIGAAQCLIDKKYTCSEKLSIGGGSNGGLLVGACITERPDLYRAAVAQVGVMDMLRFNKFTVGWEWVQEYGSPENADEFKALYAYSPLHNIKSGVCYPCTLITTADHDDRVVPGHSFKFTAAMQAVQKCDNPVLIRVDVKAGHGHGKSTEKLIDEATDKWAFLTKTLGTPKSVR